MLYIGEGRMLDIVGRLQERGGFVGRTAVRDCGSTEVHFCY